MNHEMTIPLPMPVPMLGAPSDPDLVTVSAPMLLQPPLPPSQGPRCHLCGGTTVRNGTCWMCVACGATTGCSG